MQQEGYDAHDFNLFDDRSSLLWRKPYVDGAVRELTSGDSRSQEQMRQMIERMMLAAGTENPDVRHTVRKAQRSRVNIKIDAEVDDEQDLLTDIRRTLGPFPPAHTTHPARGRGRTTPASPGNRGTYFRMSRLRGQKTIVADPKEEQTITWSSTHVERSGFGVADSGGHFSTVKTEGI